LTTIKTIGKFEILDVLGQGGMGTVYRARDPVLDRLVALKTISTEVVGSADALARFQREARAAARLQHPHIVTIYELGESAGAPFIAMELLEGQDLAEAMTPPGKLDLAEKVRIVSEVCRGLDYAHKRGVVHRDIKPANIRILRDGHVKLVDFGIARLGESTLTQTGIVLGTPSYLAPELLTGARVDHRADLWAVGVVLYELLAGRRPFQAPTFVGLAYRIVHEPLPPLDAAALGLPPDLPAVVGRALAKDPGARYPDMAELSAALQQAAGVAAAGDTPLTPEARRQAAQQHLGEARRLMGGNELERALEAARRARAVEPSNVDVVKLVEDLEARLRETPTAASPADGAAAPARPGAPTPAVQRLPTPVLTELRARGASVFRELATFGEPPAIQAVALSPVSDVLATANVDGAVRLWNLGSRTRVMALRTELHRRAGHDARPLCVAFSPDGSLLATGHVDGVVHLWDVAAQEEVPARLRHEGMVGALAFSPDGQVLASGSVDANLKLWDVAAARGGEARRELHRQPAGVTAVAFAGGGRQLVTGHANRILRVLDSETGRLQATLRGPEAVVSLLCPAPDGRRLAVGSQDRTVRLYDLESRTQVQVLAGHRRPTSSLCFFADGRHLASVALENAVQLWDAETGVALASLWGLAAESFAGVAVFAGGDHLAVALADGRIRVWEPSS
jgi:eukaryotic-like serine/threonine-protein kinase